MTQKKKTLLFDVNHILQSEFICQVLPGIWVKLFFFKAKCKFFHEIICKMMKHFTTEQIIESHASQKVGQLLGSFETLNHIANIDHAEVNI